MTAELVPVVYSADQIAELPLNERGQMITRALVESKSWLAVATKGTDPTPIAEFKAWAATVAEMTRQKGLAEEIQLDALEMVRRAERGIGVAIRNGQEAGEIRKTGERSAPHVNQSGARLGAGGLNSTSCKPSPRDFATHTELTGNGAGIYHMTNDVTDEEFESAIKEGREEGNLSRANVVRKVKAAEGQVGVIDLDDEEEGPIARPAPSKRPPLPSQFSKVTADLSRVVSRYEKLTTDDRYRANRASISEVCMPQVRRAVEVLSALMNDLTR